MKTISRGIRRLISLVILSNATLSLIDQTYAHEYYELREHNSVELKLEALKLYLKLIDKIPASKVTSPSQGQELDIAQTALQRALLLKKTGRNKIKKMILMSPIRSKLGAAYYVDYIELLCSTLLELEKERSHHQKLNKLFSEIRSRLNTWKAEG